MDDTKVAPYHYSALNASQKEIRVLVLLPGAWTQPLRCELKTVSLIERPFYCALSYVWGDPKVTKPILLHGQSVQVTTNLEAALRRLRHGAETMMIWVDALCVDQKNDSEKSLQVAMMNQIYARCDHCVVWLGDRLIPLIDEEKGHPVTIHELPLMPWNSKQLMLVGETNFDELVWGLGELHAAFMIIYLLSKNKHLHEYPWYQPSLEMDASIEALQRMTSAWWWTRAWTVQETVLPGNVIVVWGPYQARWEMFAAASRNLFRHVNSCCEANWSNMAAERNQSRLIHFASTVSEFEEIRKQKLAVFETALAKFKAKLDKGEVSLADCLDDSSEDPRLNVPFVELLRDLLSLDGLPRTVQASRPNIPVQEPPENASLAGGLSSSTQDLNLFVPAGEIPRKLRVARSLPSLSEDRMPDVSPEERLMGWDISPNARMWALQILPEDNGDRELSTMPQLLWAFRNRNATNPRDQIYALSSLVTRWYGGQPLTPDYQLPVLDVWAQTITECLKLNDLSIFMGMRSQDPQLASWVPAWNQWTEDGGTGINSNDKDTAEKQHKTYRYYTASANKIVPEFSLNNNALSLSTIYLDKIAAIGIVQPAQSRDYRSTIYALQQWQLLIDFHLQHDKSYVCKSFTKGQAFWHTVSRDMFLDGKFTRRLNTSKDAFSEEKYIELVFRLIASGQISKTNAAHWDLAGKVTSIVFAMTYKSRFFVTETGWFGIANSEIRAGDKVYLLIGSNVPSVLRNVSELYGMKNTYQLISDGYLHGMMDGEIIGQYWNTREIISII
jgi:hypothetical protein